MASSASAPPSSSLARQARPKPSPAHPPARPPATPRRGPPALHPTCTRPLPPAHPPVTAGMPGGMPCASVGVRCACLLPALQVVSTREDLLAKEYIDVLKDLQDNVPGFGGELSVVSAEW
jgi:hypothetical protein